MTVTLTIFGKAFEESRLSESTAYFANYGLLNFTIVEYDYGELDFSVNLLAAKVTGEPPCGIASKESARDWLESEARRIAREMLVMAGPIRYRWTEDEQGAAVTEFLP